MGSTYVAISEYQFSKVESAFYQEVFDNMGGVNCSIHVIAGACDDYLNFLRLNGEKDKAKAFKKVNNDDLFFVWLLQNKNISMNKNAVLRIV